MDPGKIFQIITNSTLLATRLLSGSGSPVQFSESRYCLLLAEDTPTSLPVAQVSASHRDGVPVRYSITGGNRDGLFTIDQHTGLITLAAALDYEAQTKHELVVSAETGKATVHTIVQVNVADVNDNPPEFVETDFHVTVIEEDHAHLPATILKVEARDADRVDANGLTYTVIGDGVHDRSVDKYFTITSSAELIQLRALDRDPPHGQATWRLKVQVRDGQQLTPSAPTRSRRRKPPPRVPSAGKSSEVFSHDPKATFTSTSQEAAAIPQGQGGFLSGNSGTSNSFTSQRARQYNSQDTEMRMVNSEERSHYWGLREVKVKDSNVNVITNDVKVTATARKNKTQKSNNKRLRNSSQERTFLEVRERKARRPAAEKRIQKNIHSRTPGKRNSRKGKFSRHKIRSAAGHRLKPFNRKSSSRKDFSKMAGNVTISHSVYEGENEQTHKTDNQLGHKSRRTRIRFLSRKRFHRNFMKSNCLTPSHNISQKFTEEKTTPSNTSFISSDLSNTQACLPLGIQSQKQPHRWLEFHTHLNKSKPIFINRDPEGQNFQETKKTGKQTNTDDKDDIISRTQRASTTRLRRRRVNRGNNNTLSKYKNEDGHYLDEFQVDERYVKKFLAEDGGCQDYTESSWSSYEDLQEIPEFLESLAMRTSDPESIHMAEVMVRVLVKDINDNAPVFPNETIFGDVQENGPIDLSVAVVSAWDADDDSEGTNARLTYSIDKNVIDERSGQAIFTIHPESGLIRTSICCLDRETTPEYHIQVVAVDGGGLKATSTVLVRLVDVNDNSPRLTKTAYEISVNETWGSGPPDNSTLLKVTTLDHDTSNYFFYRVVEASGWGWEHFGVRTVGNKGELYALQTLDFEDPSHRRGFRFMLQVTDRGRGGWSDPRHTHSAWVKVELLDLNDNPPEFRRPHAHVTVREDTTPGTLLVTLPAFDRDMSGKQQVTYRVLGGWGALKVDVDGGVILWRALDREAPEGEMGVAKIVGEDEGAPPLTSTATLTIIVTDVNDTPPRLLPPTDLHVLEGAPASRLGLLTATDDDVWTLGHGPPFNLSLSSSNPPYVLNLLTLKFDASADSGRGGGEIWSLGPIDREEYPHLTAEVTVNDAGGVSATYPVTIIIDDVNDNPMKEAAKTVYLWKTQGGSSEAALGRVYVADPDDWDLGDKKFSWHGPPHPLFSLQADTGAIYASTQLREGRYELTFSVSDRIWRQDDVRANVTVVVKYLSQEALAHAVPITLIPTSPAAITAGWTPKQGGGGLGMLTSAVRKAVKASKKENVEIVSVFGDSSSSSSSSSTSSHSSSSSSSSSRVLTNPFMASFPDAPPPAFPAAVPPDRTAPFACVWVCVKHDDGSFMNPIKLQGLLSLYIQELEKAMNLRVALKEPQGRDDPKKLQGLLPSLSGLPSSDSSRSHSNPSSVASLASKALPLQVVDNNSTSLVTPRLTRALRCYPHTYHTDPGCTPTSCLNGGRCVRNDQGGNRCVCPGNSWGRQCKLLSRTFRGDGWAWVHPLPPCLPTTLSFDILTTLPRGLILYSGPLSSASTHSRHPVTPMLLVQVVDGRPQVVLEGSQEPIKLIVNTTVSTGSWHQIHLHLNSQGITMMADLCGHGWLEGATNDSHCIARKDWADRKPTVLWEGGNPLQLGGLAHPRPPPGRYGWSTEPVEENLQGCISNLKVNGQLVDLGEPAYSSGSESGCIPREDTCPGGCGLRGQCIGYLSQSTCTCDSGWTGPLCATPTVPALFNANSYTKIALSFTPDPYSITTQLRLRARGSISGVLMQLAAQHRSAALTVRMRDGLACASVSGSKVKTPWTVKETCVEGYPLGDGSWHTIRVGRHGHNLVISVDDGDDWLHNETLVSILTSSNVETVKNLMATPPAPIIVDKQDGVTVGGIPEYMGVNLVTVHEDLNEICIDDVRVSGHSLPLPPAVNGTSWGQVTTLQQVETGCRNPDVCANTTCLPPLSCHPSWEYSTCSCGPGRHLASGKCQDVDECFYEPCLHGGTCYNLLPGYQCSCSPDHTGHNCQWDILPEYAHPLTAPVVLAALTLSLLMIVVFGIVLTIRLHRWRSSRGIPLPDGAVDSLPEVETVAEVVDTCLTIDQPHLTSPEKDIMYLSSLSANPHNVTFTPEGKNPIFLPQQTTVLIGEVTSDIEPSPSISLKSTSTVIDRRSSASISPKRSRKSSISPLGDTSHDRGRLPETKASLGAKEGPKVSSAVLPLPAQDDLRAYAYEGDGSPSDSLTSAVLGLCSDASESDKSGTSERGELERLLKTFPDITTLPLSSSAESHTKAATGNELLPLLSSGVKNSGDNSKYGRKTDTKKPQPNEYTISC